MSNSVVSRVAAIIFFLVAIPLALNACQTSDTENPPTPTIKVVVASYNSADAEIQVDFVSDGTDDQEEIQAAINALPVWGGKVTLPEGTFFFGVGSGITLRSHITLEGQGSKTILKRTGGGGLGLIRDEPGITDIIIKNLSIDGNQSVPPPANRYPSGIALKYVDGGLIEDVLIKNVGSGGQADAGGDGLFITNLARNITVRRVIATGIGTAGDSSFAFEIAHGAQDITIIDSYSIDSAHAFSIHNHPDSDGPQRVTINNSGAIGTTDGPGFSVQGQAGAPSMPQYIEFNNSVSENNSGGGFHVSPYTKYITINGGSSTGDGGVGIRLIGDSSGTWEEIKAIGVSVIANKHAGNAVYGNTGTELDNIYVYDGKGDVGILSYGSVRNSHVKHMREDGTTMRGIQIMGSGIAEGNEVEDVGGFAIAVVNKTSGRISGNYLHDNASFDIFINHSDNQIVEDNVSLSPEGIQIRSDSDNNTLRNNQFAGTIMDDSTTTKWLP